MRSIKGINELNGGTLLPGTLLHAGFEMRFGWDPRHLYPDASKVPKSDSKTHLESRCCTILILLFVIDWHLLMYARISACPSRTCADQRLESYRGLAAAY